MPLASHEYLGFWSSAYQPFSQRLPIRDQMIASEQICSDLSGMAHSSTSMAPVWELQKDTV